MDSRDARTPHAAVLGADDPPPFTFLPGARRQVLLLCDHAAQAVPASLFGLGISQAERDRHIGWDLHAAELTTLLAARLQAPAFLHGYSRLVIDANRFFDDPTCIAECSDGTVIPGNLGLDAGQRAQRWRQIHQPYHQAIAQWLAQCEADGVLPALIAVHSFAASMAGVPRPWPVGVLWTHDGRLAEPFMAALRERDGLLVGDNQPYSAHDGFGYTMATHAEARGLPHLLIEVRQDLLGDAAGREEWADRLHRVLAPLLAEPSLFQRWSGSSAASVDSPPTPR